jgi:hypothetical protein
MKYLLASDFVELHFSVHWLQLPKSRRTATSARIVWPAEEQWTQRSRRQTHCATCCSQAAQRTHSSSAHPYLTVSALAMIHSATLEP